MTFQNSDFKIHNLIYSVASLLLYQSIFNNPVGEAFLCLLQTLYESDSSSSKSSLMAINSLQAYGRWFNALAATHQSWQDYLITQILLNDNPFSRKVQTEPLTALSTSLLDAARHDLQILETLYHCSPKMIGHWVNAVVEEEVISVVWIEDNRSNHFLQQQENWGDRLEDLAAYYRQQGTGIFAQFKALRWQQGRFKGIAHPDRICLSDIVGYETQKETLLKNTEFLLAGYPALHVLLYGSRGSGKSSLVKALLNEYSQQGLRLIELSKAELKDLPIIVENLRDLAQKYILFVDDLSFEEDDDAFKALKVVLEGSVTARAQNVVVYATSNRRHLIREFFGDRPRPSEGDEVHAWDTLQEKLSFSDRFGLTLTFEPANQDTYLEIVHHLAQKAGIRLEADELEFRAKQWATRHNGRSGRTARQFIDFLQGELS